MMEGKPIYEYSRRQAIKDGFLIDLSQEPYKTLARKIYKYPVAFTSNVWAIIESACPHDPKKPDSILQKDLEAVIWDILYSSVRKSVGIDEYTRSFLIRVPFDPNGEETQNIHALKATCGPGDNAEPVITIMLLDEID